MLFAAAIDQRVSPGCTVCGTDALAGADAARAASTPSAPMRVGFRIASCLRVLLAPTRSGKVFGGPSRRAQLWPPARGLARAALGSMAMRLDHCVIAVSDRERSDAFYRDVLGAELVDPNGT